MAGIEKTLGTLEAVGELVVDLVDLMKRGIGLGSLARLLEVVRDLTVRADLGADALPELVEVDADEAGRMATVAYVQIKRIVAAVAD